MADRPITTSKKKKIRKSWLQSVTEQSWEPELLISGLAIFATLKIPGILENAYRYYTFHLQAGFGVFDEALPLLIYAVFTSSAYILSAAFITHFVIRAFWVGFIGLISVYNKGIVYENLPYSKMFRRLARFSLGTSEQLALRIDRVCSLIFSVAFALVLIMVGIGFVYFIFFLLYNVLKLVIATEVFDAYADVLYYVFMSISIVYIAAILILNMERFRSNTKLARLYIKLSWTTSTIILPLVYKPLLFIQYTFMSNMTITRFAGYYAASFFGFIALLLFVMLGTRAPQMFETRDFYATPSSTSHFETNEYSSNMSPDDIVESPLIDSEVISSNMMGFFIPYPKRMDELFNNLCDPVQLPDSLNRSLQRQLTNEHNINCANQMFEFSISDSVSLNSELFFSRHQTTGQQGFMGMANVSTLRDGVHIFNVRRLALSARDSTRLEEGRMLSFEADIPFWIQKPNPGN